jgi:hypothetical protein
MNLDLAQLLNPYDLIFLLVILVSFIFGVKKWINKKLIKSYKMDSYLLFNKKLF